MQIFNQLRITLCFTALFFFVFNNFHTEVVYNGYDKRVNRFSITHPFNNLCTITYIYIYQSKPVIEVDLWKLSKMTYLKPV